MTLPKDLSGHPEHLVMGVRDEVAEFAVAMEAKLRKNDHKTGWKDQPIEAHIKLMRIEMMEFDVALEFLGDEEAAKECVDIANFALIVRDKLLARIAAKKEAERRENNREPGTLVQKGCDVEGCGAPSYATNCGHPKCMMPPF